MFKVGDRVNHKKYGNGTVVGWHSKNCFEVEFDNEHLELHDGDNHRHYHCYFFGENAEPTNTLRLIKPIVREVKRAAKIGEFIKVTNTDGHCWPLNKIGKVTDLWKGWAYIDEMNHGVIRDDEYVVLEGYEPPKENPTKADNKIRFYAGEDIQCGQIVEIRKDGLAYRAITEKPKKHVYTAEQIQEAKDIVYKLLCRIWKEDNCNAVHFSSFDPQNANHQDLEDRVNKLKPRTLCTKSKSYDNNNRVRAVAFCPNTEEWNDDIMRLRAICKLTEAPMPSWIRG